MAIQLALDNTYEQIIVRQLQSAISIVIPTLDERLNLDPLMQRIDAALKTSAIRYEIVIIDDHSTDGTLEYARELGLHYPVRCFSKQGEPGKAQSILEGIQNARFQTICMIDADLQYPPERIPSMLECMNQGADIVVANRIQRATSRLRTVSSTIYHKIFNGMLHGLELDVQSGLKLFRKEIVEQIDLQPSAWSFDLELLTAAREAGFVIDSVDIDFAERLHGQTKVQVVHVAAELASAAIRNKLRGTRAFALRSGNTSTEGAGYLYKGRAFVTHSALSSQQSALRQLTRTQVASMLALLAGALFLLLVNAHAMLVILVGVISLLYFLDLLFNLYLIYRSFAHRREITISAEQLAAAESREWPAYTIFCPLYKEWEVLPQFVQAMGQLDYPADRLQIMLLLEEDDSETIDAARSMQLPKNVEIVVVPHSLPKTKPKACNYGLLKASGEYIVIYDAEDVPEPQQLKKAVLAFESADPAVRCIQAKLNFYNPGQNILTRLFTAEYSCWFDLILPGLQSINAPIPLGGTSNHFRRRDLVDLQGWDAFNVTEDCDLGIRLVKRGYHTAVMDSTTYEEANSDVMNWFWQRSRWIKGYIQTYLVHMRNPRDFSRSDRWWHALAFQMVVGGKVMSLFINPIMWCLTLMYFLGRTTFGAAIESLFQGPVLYVGVFSLIFGNFLYLYYYMMGCMRRNLFWLIKYVYLVPLYWIGMSVAAWMALYKLIRQPHQWSKTKHGLHLKNTSDSILPALPAQNVD